MKVGPDDSGVIMDAVRKAALGGLKGETVAKDVSSKTVSVGKEFSDTASGVVAVQVTTVAEGGIAIT